MGAWASKTEPRSPTFSETSMDFEFLRPSSTACLPTKDLPVQQPSLQELFWSCQLIPAQG